MPCRNEAFDETPENKEVHKLTRILCHVIELLSQNNCHLDYEVLDEINQDEECRDWIINHAKIDKERKEKEIAAALKKLTPYEIKLLKL